jgi:hypothetical protein
MRNLLTPSGCQKISQSHLLTDDGRTLGRGLEATHTVQKSLRYQGTRTDVVAGSFAGSVCLA